MTAQKFFMPTNDGLISTLLRKLGYAETDDEDLADFYMFTGGSDISPSIYNAERSVYTHQTNVNRDIKEAFYVMKAKITKKKSVGICRGFQLLNAINSVELIQHIAGHTINDHGVMGFNLLAKEIPNLVNSSHHQAVPKRAGVQLSYDEFIFATFNGGDILEGGACVDRGFMGVQYHPEYSDCPAEAKNYFERLLKTYLKKG